MGGRTVYLGQSEGALPYFRNLGYKMPEHETLGTSSVCDGVKTGNPKERNQHVLVSNCWKGRGFRVATLRVLALKYVSLFFPGVPLDQGWAVSHEGYPGSVMDATCFLFFQRLRGWKSIVAMWRLVFWFQWFQVFEGIPACDLFFSNGWISDNIFNPSEIILKYQQPVWLFHKLRFYPLFPSTRFQNDRWKSGILPIGSWMWSVAKWIMPQSRASNPQLWHRNGGMIWPTVGLFLLDTGCLEDVSLHQLLPLKREGICLTNVVLFSFLVERKNAIVSRKQM